MSPLADHSEAEPPPRQPALARMPRVIWVLGLVSLFTDVSSEMIHSLLPVFVVSVLGASTATLGLIEGIAEATASITKVFSGILSDRAGRRKPLTVLGYGMSAMSKPLFPLAGTASWVLVARFADRVGKGIRGAPRDALVADSSPPEVRGAAFGLRQALDTVGALVGPIVAIALMILLAGRIRLVFWIAVAPALASVALLTLGVEEPSPSGASRTVREPLRWRDAPRLGAAFWGVVLVTVVFTLARFSEAFLVLRAHDAGLALDWTPLALVVMNLTYAVTAYPVGLLSDRIGRVRLLALGLAILIVSDLVLALGQSLWVVMLGVALWGLHMGATQGLLAAMVADTAPAELRGSAFGVFYCVAGIASLVASLLAGALWQWHGPAPTFVAGALFSAVALVGLFVWRARVMASRRPVPPHTLSNLK